MEDASGKDQLASLFLSVGAVFYYLPEQDLAAAVKAAWILLSCCPPVPTGGVG